MSFHFFRNSTIETIVGSKDFTYSDYNDVLSFNKDSDAFIWFYTLDINKQDCQLVVDIESYTQIINYLSEALPPQKPFIVIALYSFHNVRFVNSDFELSVAIDKFNHYAQELSSKNSSVKYVDISTFTRNYTANQLIDWKFFFTTGSVLNPRLAKDFRCWFQNQLEKLNYIRKKCIVIDLDNTIWGGIIGEDGIDGLQIGGHYPGNAYSLFQDYLIRLSEIGVAVAICSKNNEQDVFDVFDKHPFMKLKREHIAAYRINWNNKAENIRQVAEELNIGMDSIVFIDDNPSERELVRKFLPLVEVPEFPLQPYDIPAFISKIITQFFSAYSLTEADHLKTSLFHSNIKRQNATLDFQHIDDYFSSLEIEIQFREIDKFSYGRAAQMSQKTNQFNLTTKRYTEFEIANILESGNLAFTLSVKDKFGDNGITGLSIVTINLNHAEIDTYLLSCRILGKNIEFAFLYCLINSLKNSNIKSVSSKYIPTNKNQQVADFYNKAGFELIDESTGVKKYYLELASYNYVLPNYFKIDTE